jgi:hypothetical protein
MYLTYKLQYLCPGDFEQLPLQRLAAPVTRTLKQSLESGVPVTLSNCPYKDWLLQSPGH